MRERAQDLVYHLTARGLSAAAKGVLARHRPLIVGITGSVGKTTTKDAVAAVLSHPSALGGQAVRSTRGNSNDKLGLPAAVLGLRASLTLSGRIGLLRQGLREGARQRAADTFPRVLVLEYGAGSKHSNVPELVQLAPPTVAVVTTIGPAHLERFGTLEAIAEHKGALVRAVPPDGLVVLGADTPHSAAMASMSAAPVHLVAGRGRELAHGVARVVGRYFGLADAVIDMALADAPSVSGRLHIVETARCTLIDDAYNASPLSMTLGLDTLAESARPGQRRVAVLGGMAELGPQGVAYHRQIGAHARTRCDALLTVGELARDYGGDQWFPSSAACAAAVDEWLREGDIVLVKGSHSVGMSTVVAALNRLP